ncbi:MAG: hypothetical protein GX144_11925 [Clostridiaceae bacterium]|jgi:hypothetical protein|nr:hypothetical protein [Clostridiaceae bacterium]
MLDALAFWILLLVLYVPGIISTFIYELVCGRQIRGRFRFAGTALIFALVILAANLAGLYLFKNIPSMEVLATYFNCLSFTTKYILLSIVVGAIIALFVCLITQLFRISTRANTE